MAFVVAELLDYSYRRGAYFYLLNYGLQVVHYLTVFGAFGSCNAVSVKKGTLVGQGGQGGQGGGQLTTYLLGGQYNSYCIGPKSRYKKVSSKKITIIPSRSR